MKDQIQWDETVEAYTVDLEAIEYRSMSAAVVATVAALADRDVRSLDQLCDAVNPDALDELVGHGETAETDCRVTFHYLGYRIECLAPRELRVTPEASREAP